MRNHLLYLVSRCCYPLQSNLHIVGRSQSELPWRICGLFLEKNSTTVTTVKDCHISWLKPPLKMLEWSGCTRPFDLLLDNCTQTRSHWSLQECWAQISFGIADHSWAQSPPAGQEWFDRILHNLIQTAAIIRIICSRLQRNTTAMEKYGRTLNIKRRRVILVYLEIIWWDWACRICQLGDGSLDGNASIDSTGVFGDATVGNLR